MSQEAHHPNVKLYIAVFAALMILTVVTVLVSYWHLPPAAAICARGRSPSAEPRSRKRCRPEARCVWRAGESLIARE